MRTRGGWHARRYSDGRDVPASVDARFASLRAAGGTLGGTPTGVTFLQASTRVSLRSERATGDAARAEYFVQQLVFALTLQVRQHLPA